MDKLGKEPAFACINDRGYLQEGISKRFYAACAAMQGLLAANSFYIHEDFDQSKCAELSYKFADELLDKEND